MPCYHPMLALIDWERSRSTGVVHYNFQTHKNNKKSADDFQRAVESGDFLKMAFTDASGVTHHNTLVPCRQCIGCRLDYSRQWANRMMLELADHDNDKCWFITLTYENEPRNSAGLMTLAPDDMTLFLKRLRKHQSERSDLLLRYYYSGEYGDRFQRPHYHMIAYSLEIPDLKFLKLTSSGPIFTSDYLDGIWQHGYCFICRIAWEDCAYTARYVTKKLKGKDAKIYEEFNIVPEFSRMSRRPGIGANQFSVENFQKGILKYVNGRPITVPDAWKRLMKGCDLETLAKVKDQKSFLTTLNYLEYNDSTYSPTESLRSKEIELIATRKLKVF